MSFLKKSHCLYAINREVAINIDLVYVSMDSREGDTNFLREVDASLANKLASVNVSMMTRVFQV
jgi:hypothetical protein